MLTYNKQNGNSSIHRLVQGVIRLNWGEERAHNLMDVFNLLIGSYPYYGETLAEHAKKRHLLPHLEEVLTFLDAWQKEHQLKKEKDYVCRLLNYITDGYRS